MSDIVFNIAKGRVVEFYHRVENADPSEAKLVLVVLQSTGIEADSVLQDYDTLADILAAANDEATNTNYARKVLAAADLASPAPDDTNNRYDIDLPDQTWSAVGAAGGAWSKLLVCYRPTNASADSAIIPLVALDFAVTPDGSDITVQFNAAGFFRAS